MLCVCFIHHLILHFLHSHSHTRIQIQMTMTRSQKTCCCSIILIAFLFCCKLCKMYFSSIQHYMRLVFIHFIITRKGIGNFCDAYTRRRRQLTFYLPLVVLAFLMDFLLLNKLFLIVCSIQEEKHIHMTKKQTISCRKSPIACICNWNLSVMSMKHQNCNLFNSLNFLVVVFIYKNTCDSGSQTRESRKISTTVITKPNASDKHPNIR